MSLIAADNFAPLHSLGEERIANPWIAKMRITVSRFNSTVLKLQTISQKVPIAMVLCSRCNDQIISIGTRLKTKDSIHGGFKFAEK